MFTWLGATSLNPATWLIRSNIASVAMYVLAIAVYTALKNRSPSSGMTRKPDHRKDLTAVTEIRNAKVGSSAQGMTYTAMLFCGAVFIIFIAYIITIRKVRLT